MCTFNSYLPQKRRKCSEWEAADVSPWSAPTPCLSACLPHSVWRSTGWLGFFFPRKGGGSEWKGWTSCPGNAAPRSVSRVRGLGGAGRGSRSRVRTNRREEEEWEEEEWERQPGQDDEGWFTSSVARRGGGVRLSNKTRTTNEALIKANKKRKNTT